MCEVVDAGCVASDPCTKADGLFAKLVAGTVNTAIAAIAIRIILLACFIFLPSKWNWPLGREENKESSQADSELEGNARQTKQRRRAHCSGKRTVNGIDTAAEYTDGVCSRSLVFLVAGTLALTND